MSGRSSWASRTAALTVGRLADHLDAVDGPEQGAQPAADDRVVVGQQHAQGHLLMMGVEAPDRPGKLCPRRRDGTGGSAGRMLVSEGTGADPRWDSSRSPHPRSRHGNHSGRQRTGLVLAGVLSAINIPSVFTPTPDGEVGPPFGVLVLGTVLGVIGLVAVVLAWRGNRGALRVAAGALVINLLTALPAFFVDVPVWIKLAVGLSVLVTVAAIVLMFSGARRPVAVLD